MTESRETVGVVGAGLMGRDIAALLATAGYEVIILDVDEDALASARSAMESTIPDALAAADYDVPGDLASSMSFETDYEFLADAVFVVEAVTERIKVKHAVMNSLEAVLDETAVVGTNTSSLTPGDVADGMAHPERVVLFHFANPAIDRDIVEISGDDATPEAIETAKSFGEAIEKRTIILDRERRGNGLSRLSASIKCSATWELQRASPAAIDRAARAVGFDRGPIEFIDLIGIDVHLATVDNLEEEYGDRFSPPPEIANRMESMVADERRGMKDGRGFFEWNGEEVVIPETEENHDVTPVIAALVNEAHEMVADGIADRDRIDEILRGGSGGPIGPFDLESMMGGEYLREVLAERYEETGAGVFEPAGTLGE